MDLGGTWWVKEGGLRSVDTVGEGGGTFASNSFWFQEKVDFLCEIFSFFRSGRNRKEQNLQISTQRKTPRGLLLAYVGQSQIYSTPIK